MDIFLTWLSAIRILFAERQYKKKINHLYKIAYRYYYDIQETHSYVTGSKSIEFLPYITESYRRKIAEDNSTKEIIRIIASGTVDETYKKAN